MPKPKVFVTRLVHQEALDLVAAETEMEVWPEEAPPSPQVLKEKARDVEGLYTNVADPVDKGLFDVATGLKVVSQIAVGVDNIDVAEATRRAIPVGHTPAVLTKTTADLTFALLMAAARRVAESDRWVRAGKWKVSWHPLSFLGQDIHGATLGIIGLGQIGLEVAKRALGFEMKVLYYDVIRRPEAEEEYGIELVDIATLLRRSDFVTLHTPLTPDTHHLIGEKELAMMKPTAIVVNASRGSVIDRTALYRALRDGVVAGAALDVTEPEPIPPDDPLLTLENALIIPHIGSASVETRRQMALIAAENLLAGLKRQKLRHCVNPEVYQAWGLAP